jgi:2-polyprenyl-3-methyl-5-hydroxy-6-metoxy-1,4-benzoquinol methylase
MTARDLELERLEGISKVSLYSAGVQAHANRYCFEILKRFLRGGSILELGPAEGVLTQLLATATTDLTLVDGSSQFCSDLSRRFPQSTVVHSLFEDFNPTRRFDAIVLSHVLEHVADPVDILRRARSWCSDSGFLFGAVPNARSLHRQAAVIMNILDAENALNDMDRHHGHRRVFDPESFRQAFTKAGLNIQLFGGYFLKPISNAQLESSWTGEMVNAFLQLGERYPDIAGEIYVVAR